MKQPERIALFHAQGGKCCYCRRDMWLGDAASRQGPHGYVAFQKRRSLPRKVASALQCTLEHLRPNGDPLRNNIEAKAAACAYCNSRRGNTPWNVYAQQQREAFGNAGRP